MPSLTNLTNAKITKFIANLNTQAELVNRQYQMNYLSALSFLPDPDPILRSKGKDIQIYRDLLIDSHLSAVLQKRKVAVLAMSWELMTNDLPEQIIDFYNLWFRKLDLHYLMNKILDAVYYGFQPFLLTWELVDGKRLPKIEDRPQEYFFYDKNNQLMIRTKDFYKGIPADEYNFVVARHNPDYLNPYGERIASKVFWPITFKKGGLKFWLTFTEKYGMPNVIGKVPRGTNEGDVNKLLNMLNNMVQDAVAVINDDESVEFVEASGKSASADIYERLYQICNNEISKAVLTVTNTVELQDGVGSYAASQTQKEGEDEKTLSDRLMVEKFFNQVLERMHRINFGLGTAPEFVLYLPEDIDDKLAKRDEILTKGVGVRFTKEYIKKNYNLNDDDFEIGEPAQNTALSELNFAESNQQSRKEIDSFINKIPPALLQLQIEQTLKPVFELIQKGSDYSEVMNKLSDIYPDMQTSQLETLLQKAMFISEIWGRIEQQKE